MKPSPVQALLLREIEPVGAYISATEGRKREVIQASGYHLASKNYQKLNPVTVNALIKYGWIVERGSRGYSTEYIISPHGRETLRALKPDDFIPVRPEFTADDIQKALSIHYQPPEWIYFPELYGGTGASSGSYHRMDGWAMNTWPSKDLVKIAFEIKVYRSDFLKELKDPRKREYALRVSNQFYFVAPKGLISVDELPPDCGLMTVSDEYALHTARAAPFRKVENPSWMFIAALGREIIRKADNA